MIFMLKAKDAVYYKDKRLSLCFDFNTKFLEQVFLSFRPGLFLLVNELCGKLRNTFMISESDVFYFPLTDLVSATSGRGEMYEALVANLFPRSQRKLSEPSLKEWPVRVVPEISFIVSSLDISSHFENLTGKL